MMFINVLVLISASALCGAQEQEVLYYEDIQSAEMREEFDRAPLISRTVTKSDWCTVENIELELCDDVCHYRNSTFYLCHDAGGGY